MDKSYDRWLKWGIESKSNASSAYHHHPIGLLSLFFSNWPLRDALQFLWNDNRCDGINDAVERRWLSGGTRNVALIDRDRVPANASLLMKKLTKRDAWKGRRFARFSAAFPLKVDHPPINVQPREFARVDSTGWLESWTESFEPLRAK